MKYYFVPVPKGICTQAIQAFRTHYPPEKELEQGVPVMKLTDLPVSRTIHAVAEEIFDLWMDPRSPTSLWFAAERIIMNPLDDGLFHHAVRHKGRT